MRDPQVKFEESHARHAPLPPDKVIQARNFKITVKDIQHKWGYLEGCEQCDYIRRYGQNRAGSQHSPACRTRILSKIAETPEGQAQLEKLETRLTRALAEHVEREDQQRPDPAVHGEEADLHEVPEAHDVSPIVEEEEIPPDDEGVDDVNMDAGQEAPQMSRT